MKEKRRHPRKRRRLLVQLDRTASFTIDVSPEGLCLGTVKVQPVNSRLEGTIRVDEGLPIPFEGRVAWVKPGDRRLNLPGKMGVALEQAIPELIEISEPRTGTR
jgi:hypothetical protein